MLCEGMGDLERNWRVQENEKRGARGNRVILGRQASAPWERNGRTKVIQDPRIHCIGHWVGQTREMGSFPPSRSVATGPDTRCRSVPGQEIARQRFTRTTARPQNARQPQKVPENRGKLEENRERLLTIPGHAGKPRTLARTTSRVSNVSGSTFFALLPLFLALMVVSCVGC